MSIYTYDTQKCSANRKRTTEQCKDWAVPFTDPPLCRRHGGNNPKVREKARKRLNGYLLYSTDPRWMKEYRLKQWSESNDRWEMRRARKAGPQAVAQLLAEREFARTEKRQIAEANARAKAERVEAWKAEQAAKGDEPFGYPPDVDDNDQPRYVAYDTGFDWDL